jgi:aminocarboxymuconate-semialdehyde decarboxylase
MIRLIDGSSQTMPRVIDVHTHVVPTRLADVAQAGGTRHGIEFSRDASGRITSSSGGVAKPITWPTPLESPEERVTAMDALGVDLHLLSLTPTMHWYDLDPADGRSLAIETNDDIGAMVADHPTRFAGLAFLPLQDPSAAVAELERCVRELGFVGAQVGTNVNGEDWDAPSLYPILEAAVELDTLLFIHPTRGRGDAFLRKYHLVNLIGNPLETTVAIAALIFGGVLDRLPALKLCFAHGGGYGCVGVGRMDHGRQVRADAGGSARLPSEYLHNLYFDSLVHSHRTLDHVIDAAGIDQVVLGSDYPADMGQPSPVEFIDSHPTLSPDQKAKILGGNAARLLA